MRIRDMLPSMNFFENLTSYSLCNIYESVAKFGKRECIEHLLSIGMNFDDYIRIYSIENGYIESWYRPLLMFAVNYGNIECVKALIDNGAQMFFLIIMIF